MLWLLGGCGPALGDAIACSPRAASLPASPDRPAIVLVTLDGARAADVLDPARMPTLHALAERGVALGDAAAPMVASGPRFVSLPGYREILTGRRGAGCVDNHCPPIDEPTLVDELRGDARPMPATSRWSPRGR